MTENDNNENDGSNSHLLETPQSDDKMGDGGEATPTAPNFDDNVYIAKIQAPYPDLGQIG